MPEQVLIYDTTLRDGAQGEGISFSKNDKLRLAERIDALGAAYIEGGWPGSNPKDIDFFAKARKLHLKHARITAFGSTMRTANTPDQDENLCQLLAAETPAVAIFGKTWLLHVKDVLRTTPSHNLEMIRASCSFLHDHGREVLFDAEHFFDAWKDDPDYALEVLRQAVPAVSTLVLCDTNGGTLPEDIFRITAEVRKAIPKKIRIGIHSHNDSELAVANSLAAVRAGARLVQGTINGFGERCGNANLCSIIGALELKMGYHVLPKENLKKLYDCSRFVDEIANISHDPRMPYVGESAFAHKGGMHVNAVEKNPVTFEHIPPEAVGNHRRILVSELSGKSNLSMKMHELNLKIPPDKLARALNTIKKKENQGYEYELAEASLALLIERETNQIKPFFDLLSFRVSVEKRGNSNRISEATVKLRVGKETVLVAAESTSGPVNALDEALRRALVPFYPELQKMSLHDYKVRILSAHDGTAAITRVLIESTCEGMRPWVTVGLSVNIIDASREALVDSLEYALMMHRRKKQEIQA